MQRSKVAHSLSNVTSITYPLIQVASKERRRTNEIKRLHGEIDHLEEEKDEFQARLDDLLDQNRKLQTANERITQENKAMKIRPDGHRTLYGKTVGPSNAVGNFDALRQEMINKVSEEVGRGLDVVLGAGKDSFPIPCMFCLCANMNQ